MFWKRLDFSAQGRSRVIAATILGTLVCIAFSFAFDGYSFEHGWRWGTAPINNILIPLILAPPFFYFLLSKLRELAIAHHELMIISTTDSLTDCFNRRAFTALVDRCLDRMLKQPPPPQGALLVIDVDHFKSVNDSFGHDIGDQALRLIADAIRAAVRDNDAVGRIGGEEFAVFLPRVNYLQAEDMAERVRNAVANARFSPAGKPYGLSISIGGATFERASSFSELYRQADTRLYDAKRNGRNRVEFHAPIADRPVASAFVH
ncbi:MAG: GGDEF domain-containing protein [Rhizobiaceae bacterium]